MGSCKQSQSTAGLEEQGLAGAALGCPKPARHQFSECGAQWWEARSFSAKTDCSLQLDRAHGQD